jgi:amphi-Trp domain-containing protein
MSSAEDNFKHVSLQDCQSIIRYLEALSDGFRQGALLFSTDNRQLKLNPQGLIELTVEAKRKEDRMKLEIKMRWSEDERPGSDLSLTPLFPDPPKA